MSPLVYPSKRICRDGSKLAFPIVRKKLCLVRCHVDVHRAVAFAPLACQTQIERLFHMFIAPSVLDYVPMHHFPKQVRPPSRGMRLFPSHHIAWAHRVLFAFAVLPATLADADAAQ